MKPILKIVKSNLFMSLTKILLVGCIILLINACIQSIIPREVVNRDVKPNDVPKVRTVILIDYFYKNRTYTNHFKSVSPKDIVSQIGLESPIGSQNSVPAFKIQGVDTKKSIAIKIKDSSLYLQSYIIDIGWINCQKYLFIL